MSETVTLSVQPEDSWTFEVVGGQYNATVDLSETIAVVEVTETTAMSLVEVVSEVQTLVPVSLDVVQEVSFVETVTEPITLTTQLAPEPITYIELQEFQAYPYGGTPAPPLKFENFSFLLHMGLLEYEEEPEVLRVPLPSGKTLANVRWLRCTIDGREMEPNSGWRPADTHVEVYLPLDPAERAFYFQAAPRFRLEWAR